MQLPGWKEQSRQDEYKLQRDAAATMAGSPLSWSHSSVARAKANEAHRRAVVLNGAAWFLVPQYSGGGRDVVYPDEWTDGLRRVYHVWLLRQPSVEFISERLKQLKELSAETEAELTSQLDASHFPTWNSLDTEEQKEAVKVGYKQEGWDNIKEVLELRMMAGGGSHKRRKSKTKRRRKSKTKRRRKSKTRRRRRR